MSLQSILQGYSQDISASQNHNNELADDNRARKAESIEDQFAHHIESMNSAATELGVASGAVHLGRKVYKKYKQGKEVYKKVEDLVNKVKAAANGGNKPTGEEGEGGSGEGAEPSNPLGSQPGNRDSADGGQEESGASRTNTQEGGEGVGDSERAPESVTEQPGAEPEPTARAAPGQPQPESVQPETQGADSAAAPRAEAQPTGAEPERLAPESDLSTEQLQSNLADAQNRFDSLNLERTRLKNTYQQSLDTMDKYRGVPTQERPFEFDQANDAFQRTGQALNENADALGQAQSDLQDARLQIGNRQANQAVNESQDLLNRAQAQSTPQAADQPTPESQGQQTVQREQPETQPESETGAEPTGDLGRNVATAEQDQFESGVQALSGRTAELESGAQRAGSTLGGAIDGTLQRAGAAVQDTVNGVKSSVGNLMDNAATKVSSAVKSVLPESIGDFLGSGAGEVLSAGLDAIPVVGEIASVVTGLVSLFEGLHHKAKPDADLTGAPLSQATTAIDPSALMKDQPTVGATIV